MSTDSKSKFFAATAGIDRLQPKNRRSNFKWKLLTFVPGIVVMAGIGSAHAQSAPPSADAKTEAKSTDTVPDIVVTAQRRSLTVQKTPISITAIGEAQLQAKGITSIQDVIRAVPGLSMRTEGPGQSELELRGLASTGGAAPTVGYYLDESPLTPPAQALNGKVVVDPNLFDISRVEVLRGPQGTLFGSGSMGGTVRIITNQPDLTTLGGQLEVDASGTIGGGPNGTINGELNIPLIQDKLAIRIVGTEKYGSGFIDRIVEQPFPVVNDPAICSGYACTRGDVLTGPVVAHYKHVNWVHQDGARIQLLAEPTPDLKIQAKFFLEDIKEGGANTYDDPPGIRPKMAHYQAADIAEPFSDNFRLWSADINYDLHFATLTLSTAYFDRHTTQTQDSAEQYLFSYPYAAGSTSPIQYVTEVDKSNQISQEIRLASPSSGKFTWIVGGYFSHLNSSYHEIAPQPLSFCPFDPGGCAANPNSLGIDVTSPYKVTQFAAFVDATYKFTPELALDVGLRQSYFKNSLDVTIAGTFGPTGDGTYANFHSSSKNHATTPKFNLSYEPSPDLTIYGTIAEGFRPGGVNQPLPVSGPNSCTASLAALGLTQAPQSYDPDSIWNYEIGEKARLFDHRLTINADFYYIRWNKIQQVVPLACGTNYADNVGNAVSYGPEIETALNLSDNWTLEANFVYTHAELTQASAASGLVSGDRILNVPLYTESTTLTYHTPVGQNGNLTAKLSNSLIGPVVDVSFVRTNLPAYNLLNARVQYEQDKWSVALYINNLTNSHPRLSSSAEEVAYNIPGLKRYATSQPLTAGLDLRARF